jgi:hypothetical protein
VDRGCHVVRVTNPYGRILGFLDRSRYYFFQVAPQLYSRGWVDPVPDPLLLTKSGRAGNRTRGLWTCSQELWPQRTKKTPEKGWKRSSSATVKFALPSPPELHSSHDGSKQLECTSQDFSARIVFLCFTSTFLVPPLCGLSMFKTLNSVFYTGYLFFCPSM